MPDAALAWDGRYWNVPPESAADVCGCGDAADGAESSDSAAAICLAFAASSAPDFIGVREEVLAVIQHREPDATTLVLHA